MCDTCPVHIPGPGEVAGGALEAAVGAALTPAGRKVMFRGLAVPFFIAIIVYTLGWWLLPITLGVLAAAAGVLLAVRRILHGHTVQARPELTPEMRAALAARGLKPIPAPARQARPALPQRATLPRGLSITKGKRALPAPAKALEGKVVARPVAARKAAR